MTYSHPLVILLCGLAGGLTLIGILGAVMAACDARKGTEPPTNPDDKFWKENGDTWLS